jgi:hypothetical protein
MRRLALPLTLMAMACLAPGPRTQEDEAEAPSDTIGEVRLHWQIDSAQDNYGFYLMRSESEDGPWVRVNERLIPGVGTTSEIHRFDYVDEGLVRGRDYWYQLYEVGMNGTEELMGTVQGHCRTLEEDVIHERREALGEEINALGDDLVLPHATGEWVVFLHPRVGQPVRLIGQWRGWEDDPVEMELLEGTQWMVAEEPLAELPTSGDLGYLFLVGEEASAEVRLDDHNERQHLDPQRGETVSVFDLGDSP